MDNLLSTSGRRRKRSQRRQTEHFKLNLKKLSIKGVGKFFTKVADKVKTVVSDGVKFAALLPLMPAMLAILTAKKVKVTGSGINAVSNTFFRVIIKGEKNYYFDENEEHLIGDAVEIVKEIIQYFKKAKAKPASELNTGEKLALGALNVAANSLEDANFNKSAAATPPAPPLTISKTGQVHTEAPKGDTTTKAAGNKNIYVYAGLALAAGFFLLKK